MQTERTDWRTALLVGRTVEMRLLRLGHSARQDRKTTTSDIGAAWLLPATTACVQRACPATIELLPSKMDKRPRDAKEEGLSSHFQCADGGHGS